MKTNIHTKLQNADFFQVLLYFLVVVIYLFHDNSLQRVQIPISTNKILFLLGKFRPQDHPNFVKVPLKYAVRSNIYLHRDTYNAFLALRRAALKNNIRLYIVSGTRTFYQQKRIWENKFVRINKANSLLTKILHILRFSAIPGGSRHHWGTEIDIVYSKTNYRLENSYFENKNGRQIYQWLKTRAINYGFCQPYAGLPSTRTPGLYGHHEEKWHWSYKPLSRYLTYTYLRHQDTLLPENFSGNKILLQKGIHIDFIHNIAKNCWAH